jgi:hypothetical protein
MTEHLLILGGGGVAAAAPVRLHSVPKGPHDPQVSGDACDRPTGLPDQPKRAVSKS